MKWNTKRILRSKSVNELKQILKEKEDVLKPPRTESRTIAYIEYQIRKKE